MAATPAFSRLPLGGLEEAPHQRFPVPYPVPAPKRPPRTSPPDQCSFVTRTGLTLGPSLPRSDRKPCTHLREQSLTTADCTLRATNEGTVRPARVLASQPRGASPRLQKAVLARRARLRSPPRSGARRCGDASPNGGARLGAVRCGREGGGSSGAFDAGQRKARRMLAARLLGIRGLGGPRCASEPRHPSPAIRAPLSRDAASAAMRHHPAAAAAPPPRPKASRRAHCGMGALSASSRAVSRSSPRGLRFALSTARSLRTSSAAHAVSYP